jgi:hypothetical protein
VRSSVSRKVRCAVGLAVLSVASASLPFRVALAADSGEVAIADATGPARAMSPLPLAIKPVTTSLLAAPPSLLLSTGPVDLRPENGYWSEGTPRWFISTKSDLGGIYTKPYFSAGYGLPHWMWAGVDLNAISTLEFGQVYGGVRASLPVFDLAFGVRDTYSYGKPFLTPRSSFVSDDLSGPGSRARYWAWEGEAFGIVPLPHAAILLDYIAVHTLDVPRGKYLYEESYRAIVANPFFQVIRVAPVLRLLRENALKIGVLLELLTTTGRERNVFRMGPAAAIQLTDHLEALGTLSVAVSSPDKLGLALGAYGLGGLRYRWATGEPTPKFPWEGTLIP